MTRIGHVMFLATLLLSGCSIKKFAINKLGDSLANSGTTFASDDDPEFVGQAVPFSLKLIEGLIAESPKHRGLLFAASSGFTQYSYVYVQQPAEEMEERDLEQSNVLRTRARKLYLRARDYGMQGLEAKHPKFATMLRENPETAEIAGWWHHLRAGGVSVTSSAHVPHRVASQWPIPNSPWTMLSSTSINRKTSKSSNASSWEVHSRLRPMAAA